MKLLMKLFQHRHRYEPRYDEVPSPLCDRIERAYNADIRSLMFYKIYVHDICVGCGNKVLREEK